MLPPMRPTEPARPGEPQQVSSPVLDTVPTGRRRQRQRQRSVALVLAISLVLPACANLQGLKLLTPQSFGLERIAPQVWIEREADEVQRQALLSAVRVAEQRMRVVWGSPVSAPRVHACVSEGCYEAFGGQGSRARIHGHEILLSPRGFNGDFLAHEWSHDEIRTRLGWRAWMALPAWFDEGLAVAVSQAPEHDDGHWDWLAQQQVPRPTRAQLMALRTQAQWLEGVRRWGEADHAARRARGEPEIRPLYTAAGHEVRTWLAQGDPLALQRLLQRLEDGTDFNTAYRLTDATASSATGR